MRSNQCITLFFFVLVVGFIISGCTEEKKLALPEDLPEFVLESDFDIIDWERKAVNFDGMIGNEKIAGVTGTGKPNLEQQNWMWHLWGIEEVVGNQLTVVGYHRDSQSIHPVLLDGWSVELTECSSGADAQSETAVKIPKPGEWAMLLYVGDELFDVLVYEIHE